MLARKHCQGVTIIVVYTAYDTPENKGYKFNQQVNDIQALRNDAFKLTNHCFLSDCFLPCTLWKARRQVNQPKALYSQFQQLHQVQGVPE